MRPSAGSEIEGDITGLIKSKYRTHKEEHTHMKKYTLMLVFGLAMLAGGLTANAQLRCTLINSTCDFYTEEISCGTLKCGDPECNTIQGVPTKRCCQTMTGYCPNDPADYGYFKVCDKDCPDWSWAG